MNLLPLFVIAPLGLAFLLPVLTRLWKGFPSWIGNIATAFLTGLSFWVIQYAAETKTFAVGGWSLANNIPIGIIMVMDGLTVLMLLVVNFIGFMATLFSVNYMEHYTDKGKYFTLFLLMIAGLNGVVLAGDLFNLFVFLEITAIASYSLVAFGVGAEELEASFKYQVLGGTASAFILLGIAFFYHATGTLNLADATNVIAGKSGSPEILFIGTLFLVGFALKAALMPFHAWLPDAHPSAPAPISAMLSGVVIKVLGVYTLIRLFFNVFGVDTIVSFKEILLFLGILSMVVGGFLALGQKDFKRLLAYSSISQIGYVIFALGIGSSLAILGALFYLISHAVFKSLLFLNSGAVVYATDSRDLNKLGGLYQKMPVTTTTAMVGSLSISGLPPMGGFWGKLVIILAAIEAGHHILAGIAVLISIVTLAYYLKVLRMVYFGVLKKAFQNIREVPFLMCFSMIVLAILSIGLGILLLPQVRDILLGPAVQVVENGIDYAKVVLGG